MERHQKALLIKFIVVITVTIILIVAMVNFKDWVNHTEAMRAMEHLGREVSRYRERNGVIPPEFHVNKLVSSLEGHARLGELEYRGRWISFDCPPEEILAYVKREHDSLLLSTGYIVLRLDGGIEWMGEKEFKSLLSQQQDYMEIDTQGK